MSLIRRRGGAAPTAAAAPTLLPADQTEQRQRRRAWLAVHYDHRFDLAAEIRCIIAPLAAEVARLPRPLAMRAEVDNIADAAHEVLSTVVGILAESSRLDASATARTMQAVRDLAQRPTEPILTDEQIASGAWAAQLISHVAPHSDDLAGYLGRALPPGHPRLLNNLSASERIEAALRVLDLAAHDLQQRIPKVADYQALPSMAEVNAANRARRQRERVERALSKVKAGTAR